MSVAWTTILVIALLLPGVFFFIGYATRERYTREIVKSGVVGEVGWAIFVAIAIHLLAWGLLAFLGFDLAFNLKQIADFEAMPRWSLVDHAVRRLPWVGAYVLATALIGLAFGCLLATAIIRGCLPFLAVHKYINTISRSMRGGGLVTAYVMTTTVENNRALMYKGVLEEFYLSPEGKFIYLVLKRCSRFYMSFEEAFPRTGEQMQLFGTGQDDRPDQIWDYLLIDGTNIANVLFDPSVQIQSTPEGDEALRKAVEEFLNQHLSAPPEAPHVDAPTGSPQSN